MKLALIGKKLSHSYSAVIHAIFFEETGITGAYKLVEVESTEKLDEKMDLFEKEGYTGINITIPYKKSILNHVDECSAETIVLDAANTVHFKDGKRKAYNTDYFGFKKTLEINDVDPTDENWLVLGYGGGAKSVIAVLRDLGAKNVKVASTSFTGADFINYEDIKQLKDFKGVVNTTPVGMYPNIETSPFPKENFKNFKTAVDIVYNPLDTKFIKEADENGLKIVRGLYMLVAQAVKAQEIWNNREFSDDLINCIYKKIGGML